MFQRDANTFLCGEHHFEAEEFPATDRQPISSRASATKRMPPTPSMTPGTQQLLNLVATKPRVEEPSTQNHKRKKVDKSRNSLKLIDEMHEVSPRTQAAAEVAAKYAVMSLNNFSIGTTASINSVDLLNKMLEASVVAAAEDGHPAAPLASRTHLCSNCGVVEGSCGVALKPCSRCMAVMYCGKDCQAQHWKTGGHRAACRKFE